MSDMISANEPSLAERYELLSRDFAIVFGERNDAIRERDELREALTRIRSKALIEMEAEGFNQETDKSWLLDAIDDALANLNKTDGE